MNNQVLYRCVAAKYTGGVVVSFEFVQVSGYGEGVQPLSSQEMITSFCSKMELRRPVEQANEYVVGCHYELALKAVCP